MGRVGKNGPDNQCFNVKINQNRVLLGEAAPLIFDVQHRRKNSIAEEIASLKNITGRLV
jgi:hypothetical protein